MVAHERQCETAGGLEIAAMRACYTRRGKNALVSAASAMLSLLLMSLWIGGSNEFSDIVSGCMHLFLLISFIALVFGALVSAHRIRWSVLLGTLTGLADGTAIVWHAVSGI